MSNITKIFFYAGLIIVVICSIELSITDISTMDYTRASQFGVAGIIAGLIFIITAFEKLSKRGLLGNVVVKGIVFVMIPTILFALGLEVLQINDRTTVLIIENYFIAFLFPLSWLALFIKKAHS